MIVFAWNRSSWDEKNDSPLPGSMCDLITQPVLKHLTIPYKITRQPRKGAVNVYSSSRSNFDQFDSNDERAGALISHGIADKNIRTKLGHFFDSTAVPSSLYADQLIRAHIPPDRIAIVGYSKLDPLFSGDVQGEPKDGRVRVLYAPTQGGGGDMLHMDDTKPPQITAAKRSSWWRRDEVLSRLDSDVFNVVPCFHPRYTPGHRATLAQYVGADVVIADGGSTLWEAMVLGIPVVTPYWITGRAHAQKPSLEGRLYQEGLVRHATRPDDLARIVSEAAAEGQLPSEVSLGLKVLPEQFRGRSGEAHADWIETLERLH